jgi:hypothetical protein
MSRLLQISVVAALLVTSCRTTNVSSPPSGMTVRYHNTQYGLTFLLPTSWRAYSVAVRDVEGQRYSPTEGRQIIVGHTPMITLRHPQSQAATRYQDIPILVFTRAQWDALHRGEFWPSLFAGGATDELWHNQRFVFAMSSRYNWEELEGSKEVVEIIEHNRADNRMRQLYSE